MLGTLLALAGLLPVACGGDDGGPRLAGRFTSRPAHHGESAEAVAWFGADTLERLHRAGNEATPLVELELRADRTFELRGEVVPDGAPTAHATGRWRPAGRGVRLDVTAAEDATGLASALVVRLEGEALVWPHGPDADDALLLFREGP